MKNKKKKLNSNIKSEEAFEIVKSYSKEYFYFVNKIFSISNDLGIYIAL